VADPDTDFETAYPGGCDGPDVLAVTIQNLTTGTFTLERMELESTGPLVLSTDTFTFLCRGSSRSVYIKITFNSLDVGGVVANIHNDSDDSVLQEYTNSMYSWDPLAAGNLHCGPDDTSCDCGSVPYNLCFSVPTR
jgi:hypothetical protein